MKNLSAEASSKRYDVTLGADFVGNYLRTREGGLDTRYPGTTYYDVPPIKGSDYGIRAAISFFSEGLAGASQLLGTILSMSARGGEAEGVIRSARYTAVAGGIVAPSFFIADLHTRGRWFNMLRIFKTTSVMSLGTWSLSLFGLFSGLTAGGQFLWDQGFSRAGESAAGIFQVPASLAGSVISLYMGTELESTATPLWSGKSPLLPPLFAVVNCTDALAALELSAGYRRLHSDIRKRLDGLAILTGLAAVAMETAIDASWSPQDSSGSLDRRIFRYGVLVAGGAIPLGIRVFHVLSGKRFLASTMAGAVLTLAGGFLLPVLLLSAGNRSSKRPRSYFEKTEPRSAVQETGSPAIMTDEKGQGKARRRRAFGLLAGLGAIAFAVILSAALQKER